MSEVKIKTAKLIDGSTVTGTIQEWADKYNLSYPAMWERWKRGVPIDFSGIGWSKPRRARTYPFRISTSDEIIHKTAQEASVFPGWHDRALTTCRMASARGDFMDLPPRHSKPQPRKRKPKPVKTSIISAWVTRPADPYIAKAINARRAHE